MGLIALAGVADFVALEFGDVTLVTPLGSVTLIANIFMANWFHGEKLYVASRWLSHLQSRTVSGVCGTMVVVELLLLSAC